MSYVCEFFSEGEFNRCSPSCSMSDCCESSLERLDYLRRIAGVPLVLNSAFRSSEWDRSRGRSGNGAHTTGNAFDIRCRDSRTRYKIIRAAILAGFHRIGVYPTFIHVDDSKALSPNVIWFNP